MISRKCYNCGRKLSRDQAKFCSGDCRESFRDSGEEQLIDFDQQDRNAAESERLFNLQNER